MLEIFLLCLVATVADNCETIHPDLNLLIPYDELNHILKPQQIDSDGVHCIPYPPLKTWVCTKWSSFSYSTTSTYIIHNIIYI